MVKVKKENNVKPAANQGEKEATGELSKIGANTRYETCQEHLTAYGGLLALVKFLDLIKFKEIFNENYNRSKRKVKLGCYGMIYGLLMLLFIGFQRIGHFRYLRKDGMLCGILEVELLPAISTFWRYLIGIGIHQSRSLLKITGVARSRVWELCGLKYEKISINIDTTVTTVYGKVQGGRKGHNTKHRGKKGLRPVLCFIEETREYLCGSQRRGETISGQEVAKQILSFKENIPSCVRKVVVRGDGEFIGWESISACLARGYIFIFGNKRCNPRFPLKGWYRKGAYDYNECMYQPHGWAEPCRFVVMRILKEDSGNKQQEIFDEDRYDYRVFATNDKRKPHIVIADYDKRADCENSIGEAQREGIAAIPSKRFQSNHAYFQIVMLAYNLWRWMKLLAGSQQNGEEAKVIRKEMKKIDIVDNTIRVARLKMLFVPAKIVRGQNCIKIKYSVHDSRASGIIDFLEYLDRRRGEKIKWQKCSPVIVYRKAS